MISITNLTMRFGRVPAVDSVSLTIESGNAVALWGTNGAGKSTLIRCILGLVPFEGAIRVAGHDVRRSGKQVRRLIGYVPQELGFYDELRVDEAVAYFARLKGETGTDTSAVLDRVSLSGHEHKRIRDLSGGMKQRLALAIALLGEPPILMLDEVTASLDACGREEFVALLARLTSGGRTLLFASHRLDEITTLAHRVAVLERGKITANVDATAFPSYLGHTSTLHLHIASSARARAMDLLRSNGFRPHLNGVGLLVPVPKAQKAAPFRVLAEARISIEDFEILATHPASSSHTEEMA